MASVQNREYTARQISDLAEKIDQAEASLSAGARGPGFQVGGAEKKKADESALSRVAKDRYVQSGVSTLRFQALSDQIPLVQRSQSKSRMV